MLDTLLWVAVGAFLGWNFPQPFWAVMFQNFVKTKWAEFKAKK
jgi:hypothetical protein